MALGLSVASDIANAILDHYVRGKAFAQTIQKRPLLEALGSAKKTFPAGKQYISEPVQGVYMSDTNGFFAGYSEDDQLTFTQAQNILRAQYPWKEVHAGLIISWTELKKDGITISDNQKTSEHTDREIDILTDLLENRMDDFGESWARSCNTMFWSDGTQDAKQVPGVLSILTDNPAAGTTGGLSRATYAWWRHRAKVGANKITPSAEDQTLSKTLQSEVRLLTRFGGAPDTQLCGSDFLNALELEYRAKGIYTQQGFTSKPNDIGMREITLTGLGKFTYDPTLDDLGLSKRCYIFDSKRLRQRPMDGEDNKTLTPERPYNYMVFLKSMTWTGGLECYQLNANGVYEVA